jgi:hypothetical protein
VYPLSVAKEKDFDLKEITKWINDFCKVKEVNYREYPKNALFFFDNIDDAFQFRIHWDAPIKRS